jgi:putative transposase
MRNILDATPKSLKEELYPRLRVMLNTPDLQTARLLFSKIVETYQDKIPKAIKALETGFDDATAVLILPEKYLKRLRTSNAMERLIEEMCY